MSPRFTLCLRLGTLLLVASSLGLRASEALFSPLPEWSEEERAILEAHPETPLLLGGLLWPRGVHGGLNVDPDVPILTQEEVDRLESAGALVLADSPDLAQPVADLEAFLPPTIIEEEIAPEKPAPTPVHRLQKTTAEFAELCYHAHPDHYVVDPSYHLTELEREDLERFLEYHAGDAKIRAMLLVIGREEVLSDSFDLARLAQGSVLRDNTALLVLPAGEPWRARLFFSSNIHQGAEPNDLGAVLSRVTERSKEEADHEEQLHRMLVEFSIQLFQLEQKLAPPAPPPTLTEAPAPSVSAPVATIELAEVFVDEPLLARMFRRTMEHRYAPWILCAALSILAAVVWLRWRSYRLRHYEWILPEVESVAPRLGGPYSGGGGVMIAYR
jgi:hypothetical protein